MNGEVPLPLAAALDADRRRLGQRLARAARRTRRRSDPEATHDVRVTTRQLDAFLDVWRDGMDDRWRRRARRGLGSLRRDLGPARELRVGIDLMNGRRPELDSEAQVGIAMLIDRWSRSLRRLERRASSACTKARIRDVRRRVKRALAPAWGAGSDPSRMNAAATRLGVRRHRAIERVRAAVADATDARLHAARVAIKRWRYATDRFEAIGHAPDPTTREALISLQTWLGRIQDLAVLRDRLRPLRARLEAMGAAGGAEAIARLTGRIERERLECVETFRRHVLSTSLTPAPVLPLPPLDRKAQG